MTFILIFGFLQEQNYLKYNMKNELVRLVTDLKPQMWILTSVMSWQL